jgi:hypothetical protein
VKLDDLTSLDWDDLESAADWTKRLNELLGLKDLAATPAERAALADALDEFARRSTAPEIDVVVKLDRAARRAARALRLAGVEQRLRELDAAVAEFDEAARQLGLVSQGLAKEAQALRAERVTAAIDALTQNIGTLKALSQTLEADLDAKVAAALAQATAASQRLRTLLEKL